MKKASIFFLLMLLLTVGIFILDWLKATYFLYDHHALFVIARTFYWPVAGIPIMKYAVTDKIFKIFLVTYLALWGGYFLIKMAFWGFGYFPLKHISHEVVSSFPIEYLIFVKLLTPFPFIFFWLVDKAFALNQKKQSV